MESVAYLNNKGDLIQFKYGNTKIRFKGPYSLERIEQIKKWDNGYLVVSAKYSHTDEAVEDYIDLIPILENLYIKPEKFLHPIKEVKLDYAAK